MNIFEFADVIDHALVIRRYPNQDERWSAIFEYAEVSEGAMLAGRYGNANTAQGALDDYLEQIRGATLVFNATSPTGRREYVCPKNIVGANL